MLGSVVWRWDHESIGIHHIHTRNASPLTPPRSLLPDVVTPKLREDQNIAFAGAMSARKRLSLGGLRGRASPASTGSGAGETGRKSSRRTSIGSWASGLTGALKTSIQQASQAADRFERRLFAEYDDEYGDRGGEADAYGALYAQRGQGQRAEFESRCVFRVGRTALSVQTPFAPRAGTGSVWRALAPHVWAPPHT